MSVLAWLVALIGFGSATLAGTPGAPAVSSPAGKLAPNGPSYEIARVRGGRSVELRSAPGGAALGRLGAKTEFDSPRTFYVEQRRGQWLGVPAPNLPNGELGWIDDDPSRLETYPSSYALFADLAARQLELRWAGRLVERIPVTVGRPGSETPTGIYSVTDGLAGARLGPWYGCCILALSGHQPNLPAGWIGGGRIAIHGTPGPTGLALSAGCLRASNLDMTDLFALVPLGTPVFIRDD